MQHVKVGYNTKGFFKAF